MADFDEFDSLKDNRFAHLLKPIRDLSENFSIDLAHELEEYLEQLEHAQFTFEGAKPSSGMVDFAEAALLIQGSTCVYSKKVEYLYNLVYQALEAVKGKKRQQQGLDGQVEGDAVAGGRAARGGAARGLDEDEEEGLERFWDIEQLLKETGDVDLGEGDSLLPAANTSMRQPAALLALEDHSQGAASGAAPGAKGDGDSGVYRLQQCYVHCSGALLLDARDGDFYDHLLRYVGPRSREDKSLEALIASQQLEQPTQLLPLPLTQLQPQPQPDPQAPGPGEQPQAQPDAVPEAEPLGAAEQQPMEADGAAPGGPMPSPHGDDDGYFDGGGGGPEDWPADDEPMGEAAGAMAAGAAEGEQQPGEGPQAEAGPERPRRAAAAAAAAGGAVAVAGEDGVGEGGEQEDEEEFDPYKPLDPASKGRMPDRPLVVRKPRRTRRPPSASLPARTHSAAASLRPLSLAAAMTGGGGLLLPEFAYCLPFLRPMGQGSENEIEADGQRGKNKKDLCKARQAGGAVALAGGDAARPVFDAQDAAAAVAADMAAAEEPLFGGAAAGVAAAAGAHGGDAWDDGYFGDAGGGGGGASDMEDDEPPNDALGGWEDGDGEDGRGMGRWAEGGVPPMALLGGGDEARADGDDGQSYEELCRAHMESMLRAAAAREVQSDLAKRVGNWRNRIDPVLKAEESRPAFDIQDYGERIIDRLANLQVKDASPGKEAAPAASKQQQKRVGFGAVAAQLQKYEISRLFSAMLQLINNRNVAIHKAEAAAAVPDGEPFALELLSRDMYHKHMGDRLAADRIPQARGEAGGGLQDEGDGDDENYGDTQGGTQTQRQKGGARGKAGGAKRAKKAGAAPLAEANAMVD